MLSLLPSQTLITGRSRATDASVRWGSQVRCRRGLEPLKEFWPDILQKFSRKDRADVEVGQILNRSRKRPNGTETTAFHNDPANAPRLRRAIERVIGCQATSIEFCRRRFYQGLTSRTCTARAVQSRSNQSSTSSVARAVNDRPVPLT